MKFTLSWLKEHLDTDADLATVLARLNAIGLEVEGVDDPAAKLAGFRVARVLTAERHPQADKLQVLSVDTGDGAPLQVVCGAPNARAGLVGVLGLPGAVVPANGMELKVSAIRGVESNGMMCSTRELELGDDHDGIIELAADAPVGTDFATFAGLSDPVIDVSVTPNRQDCMGVRGIARDLAAAGLGTLRPLEHVYRGAPLTPDDGPDAAPAIAITDPDGCPAFYAQNVSGVANGEAPEWMRRKLTAIGQKPISALVDVTNFVSVDLGRPLHVYDRAKLTGTLTARRAQDGEQVLALNGKTYALTDTMTVIADGAMVHDIAGIMGGEHSGVGADTRDVLIECAYFTPESIARTGQALALTSDARQRFERGVDPAFLDTGLALATWLVTEHCGGTISAVTRVGTPPVATRTVAYDPALAATLGGVDVAKAEQQAILERLGFGVSASTTPWQITVPTWRRDIDGAADIVEEIARIVGLDHVVSTPLTQRAGVALPVATADQRLERRVRRTAALLGLNEAVTWSFLSQDQADRLGGGDWTLANPISEDMKVMRPTLLAGLLAAAQRNADRGQDSIALFEVGRRYFRANDGTSVERPTLAFVLAGDRAPRAWHTGRAQPWDGFAAKALAEALLAAAGAPTDRLMTMGVDVPNDAPAAWHPGQSGTLRLGPKQALATFGVIHPRLVAAFDLTGVVAAGELYLDAIPAKRGAGGPARAAFHPSALQPVRRDFAFLVPDTLAAADLIRAVRGADKVLITDARLFDRFVGVGVPEGQVSLAVEVTLQPVEKTLTDADIRAVSDAIVTAAAKLGAVLRG